MFYGYDPKDVVISWDNEYGLDVKDIQKALRRKKGVVKIDLRSGGLAILRVEQPTEETMQAWALRSYANGIVKSMARILGTDQIPEQKRATMIQVLSECAANDDYARGASPEDVAAAIDAAVQRVRDAIQQARP